LQLFGLGVVYHHAEIGFALGPVLREQAAIGVSKCAPQ
jgi:hypothetical protein